MQDIQLIVLILYQPSTISSSPARGSSRVVKRRKEEITMKADELVKEINAIKRIQVELVDDFKFVFYEESEVVPFFELLLDAKNLDDGRSHFKYADSVFMQDFAKMLSILNEYIETPLAQRTTPQKFYLWFI